jgi:cell division septum initiation protein DivIVA
MLPPEVTGNGNYPGMIKEQQALEAQIKELKAKVFNPRSTAKEIEAAVKKTQELESRSLDLRYQLGLMTSSESLPASAVSRSRSEPLKLPDRKYQR